MLTACLLPGPRAEAGAGSPPGGERAPGASFEPLKPVAYARADHVIGRGSPQSITEKALANALRRGGVIVFNTGGRPATLKITETMYVPQTARPVVLDGMGLVTLDGDLKHRIIQKGWKTELTVQRMRLVNARTEKSGAAINVENWDGRLTVIDCRFENCRTTSAGPDIGGGAMRATGQLHFRISGCVFRDCSGSNGGAVNSLGCRLTILKSIFENCEVFGTGGGADRGPTGQGGIGGAVYIDGVDQNAEKVDGAKRKELVVSGCLFKNNTAKDHAGAIFGYTRPGQGSVCHYDASVFEGNTVTDPAGLRMAGAIYSQHCHLRVTNCIFARNTTPRMAGAIFTALMESIKVSDSDFYGNKPEFRRGTGEQTNVGFRPRLDPAKLVPKIPEFASPPEPKKAQADKPDRAKPLAPKPRPALRPVPGAVERFDARLRARLAEELAAGRRPRFHLSAFRQRVTVVAADGSGSLKVRGGPLEMKIAWSRLTLQDRRNMALALVREGTPADHALAAFYFTAAGDRAGAEEHLAKAGGAADEVRSSFGGKKDAD